MSRIGILTYHRSVNYGAVMQSMALADALKQRFPEAQIEIIDYMSRRMEIYYKLFTLYRGRDSVQHIGQRMGMYRAFSEYWKQMPLSADRLVTDDIRHFNRWIDGRYDIIVTGSDAVWNYDKRGLPNPYFLDGVKAKRFSYAASCNGLGLESFSDIPSVARDYLQRALSAFTYIGTRDAQTEAFVKSFLPDAKVFHNCDPSILRTCFDKNDRETLKERLRQKYGLDMNRPVIGIMLSNLNGDFSRELLRQIHKRYGDDYQSLSLYSFNRYTDIHYAYDLTPYEWSLAFGLFDLTISKYFHGTMFSLLNHTPVMSIGAEKRNGSYLNKIEDALERMDLIDFYFPASSSERVQWPVFMEHLDAMLKCPPVDRIETGIRRERESAESFFRTIEEVI